MSATPNKKISKIIIFFNSLNSGLDIKNPSLPPPLSEIDFNNKTHDTNTAETAEEGSLVPTKQLRDDNETSSLIVSQVDGNDATRRFKGCASNIEGVSNNEIVDDYQNVLVKIKEEPDDNFEYVNIEDEQSSISQDVPENFPVNIKPELETICAISCNPVNRVQAENKENISRDTQPNLSELVNKLTEEKNPKPNKQILLSIPKHNINGNNTSKNGNNNKSSKCRESKCNRCTLLQTAFNALACSTCRQILEPLWRLGIESAAPKTYRCKYTDCSKTYARQGDLNIHHRVHTGERPYTCSICDKRFSANNNLRRHLKVHTGDKPFICQRCGKRFMTNSCLKRHLRIHTSSPVIFKSFDYGHDVIRIQRGQ